MSFFPTEPPLPIDNCQQLIENALVDAGIVGIDEAIEQPVINRAFTQVNWLLAQWARKRWLCYQLKEYAVTSNGSASYSVGLGQDIDINPRPDRLEYAFLRFLQGTVSPGTPVDIPLSVISSHEDYSRITVKFIGTIPWRIFYDPNWPIGSLRPWPIPQASLYQIHAGFKVVLPRFQSLQQKINFPPEYEVALNWCLARRLRASYQMPADPTIDSLARDALNAIRLAGTAVSTLQMPRSLRMRNRAYDFRGDTDSQ